MKKIPEIGSAESSGHFSPDSGPGPAERSETRPSSRFQPGQAARAGTASSKSTKKNAGQRTGDSTPWPQASEEATTTSPPTSCYL